MNTPPDSLTLPEFLRYLARNDYTIDGRLVPAGEQLERAATHLEEAAAHLEAVAAHLKEGP